MRKVVEREGLDWQDAAPFSNEALGSALLTPTRLYVRPLLEALQQPGIRALAHITGGGLTENLPRILPEGLGAEVDLDAWEPSPVFYWLAQAGNIAEAEMLKTFNAGIGMVVVVSPETAAEIAGTLDVAGERVFEIGRVVAGQGVSYRGKLL